MAIAHGKILATAGNPDHRPMQAAINTEWKTAQALIATAPASIAGLQALELHLRDQRHHSARWFVTIQTDCGPYCTGGDAAVDHLMAQHAARLAG